MPRRRLPASTGTGRCDRLRQAGCAGDSRRRAVSDNRHRPPPSVARGRLHGGNELMRTISCLSRTGAALAVLVGAPLVANAQEAEVAVEEPAPQLASGLRLSLRLEPGFAAA